MNSVRYELFDYYSQFESYNILRITIDSFLGFRHDDFASLTLTTPNIFSRLHICPVTAATGVVRVKT